MADEQQKGLSGAALLAPEHAGRTSSGLPITPVAGSAVFFIVVAGGAMFLGVGSLSQATQGVGLIAIGCAFLISARIAQAAKHHRETMAALSARE